MYISLRIKITSLLFILLTALALIINESSTSLINEKTEDIFQQRIELLMESIKSYWDSEKNQLLNNSMLYAETERIINYSTYGLYNLLQKELERLISKTGFHELEITMRNGLLVSSNRSGVQQKAPLNPSDTTQNLSLIFIELTDEGLFLTSEVPVHKLGEFIGRLTLKRKLDDTRLKKMARNLQAEVSVAVKETVVASSLSDFLRNELNKVHFRSSDRKEDIFTAAFGSARYSIGRINLEKTEDGDPMTIYLAVSQDKMLSLVEEARSQNLSVTAWILLIALFLAVAFSEIVLIKRIRKIRDGANIIAEGNLGFQIESIEGDELGNLGRSFNLMARSLNTNQEKLRHYIERIEKLANYIQNILGSLRTCVITWNLAGRIETANNAAMNELSELYSEIEGLSLRFFLKKLKAESKKELLAAFRQVTQIDNDRQFDIEFDVAGGIKVFQSSFSLLLDNEKKPYGLILTMTNVTQKKIIEQQLYHADKLSSIGQLAASVAHEIKNPLASIKTLGQLLQEETEENDTRREYIDVIVSEVNRLNGVVEQLLKYARPEGSSFREIEFGEVIRPVLALVNHESERQRVSLSADYKSDLKVYVDSEKIKQVFLNLIFNAIQAMSNGGMVKIIANREERASWTTFEIEDNGSGMPPETAAKIFEPFFTTRQRGTGLGMAIVKKIIDLHGGKIEVHSEPGIGTRIRFYLPDRQKG